MNVKSGLLISLSISAIGGVAIGTYFLWPKSKSKSIKALRPTNTNTNSVADDESIEDKLQKNQYEVLSSDSNDWTQIVLSYKKIVSKNQALKFDDFDGSEPSDTTIQPRKTAANILSEKCQNILKAKTNKGGDYKKAEKWCIKPQVVSEKLKKFNLTALNTTLDNKIQDTQWLEKLENHKNSKINQLRTLKTDDFEGKSQEEKIKAIKVACSKLNAKKTYEADFDSSLKKSKLWCAI